MARGYWAWRPWAGWLVLLCAVSGAAPQRAPRVPVEAARPAGTAAAPARTVLPAPPAAKPGPAATTTAAPKPVPLPRRGATSALRLGVALGGVALLAVLGLILVKSMSRP